MNINIKEEYFTLIVIAVGIILAVAISPKNSYFFINFAYYWVPQAIIIFILMYLFKFRLALIVGTSIALTFILIYFKLWVNSSSDPMAANIWLAYPVTIAGTFLTTSIYGLLTKSMFSISLMKEILVTIIVALSGFGAAMLLLCLSLIHCGWF